ncbi:hypothetical protein PpBr36_07730 [Pyricularia pennisetigena]|uniref:hypothetical protein n=1 Tax=Pyricularia pennisetigena TaxID=1578925 RepID=UPI0011517832|nr:hypothetical protein PpBr36_07730 [Pyricularia pennisetigena]TLS25488.1 hypothetical protein PpBr36_07730 [Pyricularia pennisetigena]
MAAVAEPLASSLACCVNSSSRSEPLSAANSHAWTSRERPRVSRGGRGDAPSSDPGQGREPVKTEIGGNVVLARSGDGETRVALPSSDIDRRTAEFERESERECVRGMGSTGAEAAEEHDDGAKGSVLNESSTPSVWRLKDEGVEKAAPVDHLWFETKLPDCENENDLDEAEWCDASAGVLLTDGCDGVFAGRGTSIVNW